ncbi:hypothetical protein [Actinomyces oricola]|uniref:hypothetical protein n=1 Tax=Actinomyces oricola TaxID=206043 RepID=UPI000FFE53EA|nr:hypothetical protein [Actinomyces oricola]
MNILALRRRRHAQSPERRRLLNAFIVFSIMAAAPVSVVHVARIVHGARVAHPLFRRFVSGALAGDAKG